MARKTKRRSSNRQESTRSRPKKGSSRRRSGSGSTERGGMSMRDVGGGSSSRGTRAARPRFDEEEMGQMTRQDLYRRAQEMGIEGRSKMTKHELMMAVRGR